MEDKHVGTKRKRLRKLQDLEEEKILSGSQRLKYRNGSDVEEIKERWLKEYCTGNPLEDNWTVS